MIRLLTDPPSPGECKLRIKSDGTWEGTTAVVVDSDGRELELLGVMAIAFSVKADPELAVAELRIKGSVETELDSFDIGLRVEGPKS